MIKLKKILIIFFSMIFFIVDPKFPTKNAIKKNLEPLVINETTIKYNKLKFEQSRL